MSAAHACAVFRIVTGYFTDTLTEVHVCADVSRFRGQK